MPSPKLASVVLWLSAALAVVILPTAGALPPPPSSNCRRSCGQVEIPYPFGIGPADSPDHCAMPGFNLSCNDTGNGIFKPYHTNVEFLNISLEQGQARVLNHISSYCYNSSTGQMDPEEWHLNFTHLPYRFSDTSNMFTVIGCRTLAYIDDLTMLIGICMMLQRAAAAGR